MSDASESQRISREAIFDTLEASGDLVRCPACGCGRVTHELADRVAAVVPHVDRAAPTPREMPSAVDYETDPFPE